MPWERSLKPSMTDCLLNLRWPESSLWMWLNRLPGDEVNDASPKSSTTYSSSPLISLFELLSSPWVLQPILNDFFLKDPIIFIFICFRFPADLKTNGLFQRIWLKGIPTSGRGFYFDRNLCTCIYGVSARGLFRSWNFRNILYGNGKMLAGKESLDFTDKEGEC